MNLNDLDKKNYARQALRENFEVNFQVDSLDKATTKRMLNKVTSLIKEAKQTTDFYKNSTSSTYMKLVFMEQALGERYQDLMNQPARIVVENEEVEKSQVILAAQDMIDTVQKMIEDISDMQVKELPALVSSIQSEIGANESSDFNNQVTEALSSLSTALQSSKATLQSALGVVTGQGGDSFADASQDLEEPSDDFGGQEVDDDMADDLGGDDLDLDLEEPEFAPVGGVGRAKR
jgi:hypothetical protein